MNIWEPKVMPAEFWSLQDAYLQETLTHKRVTGLSDLQEVEPQIYLWQGDITSLEVDAIVNAANSQLLGCFVPHHRCIDNAIHSQAGLQLRLACYQLMKAQGHLEAIGQAKITPAYNLPANYVIHTVGPIIQTEVGPQDEELLASSYRKSLELAVEKGLTSIAFCCISTGEFRFPQKLAAEIAVRTVRNFIKEHSEINVIFNVFKDEDREIYQELLGAR
ncbi:TPA: protein-ADP-ribose hydrolase [Streptococcus suis]|uniref:protein-ADP-ribose hydrolase n=1 Tax=Streptococcus suis TaxID=1307 RepID=UPI0009A168EC|nr:protein-ADP-ribose hydrolase [Streptococcus suis]HEL2027274.1 protein-ADP-ribose hydrolase [Streptococcus suis]HEM5060504.1 protein-ADP-ribose hydrolase [Streptococcus suis]HEM5078301.1 protein-ADP-ribose hydrolase [Streptococcus suis]HEM5140796.1 protein-ADP-ribose hydrolase [Streptococcus suis]HEM5309864.1 protein-ADP-ribose hydrolase [Streptococcus suis]